MLFSSIASSSIFPNYDDVVADFFFASIDVPYFPMKTSLKAFEKPPVSLSFLSSLPFALEYRWRCNCRIHLSHMFLFLLLLFQTFFTTACYNQPGTLLRNNLLPPFYSVTTLGVAAYSAFANNLECQ